MKRIRRKLVYYSEQSLNIAGYLVLPLLNAVHKGKEDGAFEGIFVFDHQGNTPERIQFVLDALCLIAEHDPRRFRIVQKEMSRIFLLSNSRHWGCYYRYGRIMQLDVARHADWFEKYPREWCTVAIASVIIHEATHGYLHSRYYPYLQIKNRIERICMSEQTRFLRRVPSNAYNFARDMAPDLSLVPRR
jgi:hypothetical protein